MRVITRRAALVALAGSLPVWAAETDDVHQLINSVVQGLSGGDASLAMESFSKDYAQYDALSGYFGALTAAYDVDSQLDYLDEEVSGDVDNVRVRWALTLTTHQSAFTTNRSAEIDLKAVKIKGKWQITEFAPMTIFDPQAG